MKALILAAGQGTRLRPLTDTRPKCLVEYKGKALLDYTLETLRACGITEVVAVCGYRGEMINRPGLRHRTNPRYQDTNMVYTLFCAEEEFDDDIIISYGDIIYRKEVLRALLACDAPICTTIDTEWEALWRNRMEDPLSDVETMKLDSQRNIRELGKKPTSLKDIEGQYMGLIKISHSALKKVREFYHSLDRNAVYDGKNFENMYMTSFIQLIIDRLMAVKAVHIQGGWLEIDSVDDLKCDVDLT